MAMGCSQSLTQEAQTLSQARKGHVTQVNPQRGAKEPVDVPPASLFHIVSYAGANGPLAAYLTPDSGDGKRHPAIVWITGGDCNSIGDMWTPASRDNDQTAAAYRKAGLIMMFPSLRGGNQNPGAKEGFYGEVDDVIAATQYLAQQKYVDPARIYLGGHSTGGTLALLVAERSNAYRAVFAYGPVADVSTYSVDSGFIPFNVSDREEVKLRSPGYWLSSIHNPTWVIEGGKQGNIRSVKLMEKSCTNPKVTFIEVLNGSHFTVLAPVNDLIAKKLINDTGAAGTLTLTSDEVNNTYDSSR